VQSTFGEGSAFLFELDAGDDALALVRDRQPSC
jgi:hypothetical protein